MILKRKNNIKNNNENIEEYENLLYEKNNDIHIKIEENEKINILTNELTKMKEEDKNIFTYYYYQSKSIKDISGLLKISQIKVKSRLSRIRKKLKKELGKCEDNKITINPEIVKYNRNIIDYIVLHQYCHLKYKTHSKGFMKMIEKYEPKFEDYEKIG